MTDFQHQRGLLLVARIKGPLIVAQADGGRPGQPESLCRIAQSLHFERIGVRHHPEQPGMVRQHGISNRHIGSQRKRGVVLLGL